MGAAAVSEIVNLAECGPGEELEHDGFHHFDLPVGPLLGADLFGCSIYDVPPGKRNWPYHYHVGNEEWLIVIAGRPTLRTSDGERELAPGDVVAFPEGEAGAHDVSNRTADAVRIAIFSTLRTGFVEYTDSGKIGVGGRYFQHADAVDYWHGETR
jgi:uncharacterized cupin superfamily protein